MALSEISVEGTMEDYFPSGLKICVIDDDPTFFKGIQTILLSCNYKATSCNSLTAVSFLRDRAKEFDLLLADNDMRAMSGFELLDFVHAEVGIAVILMTVGVQPEVMNEGLSRGASCFLMKPPNMSEIKNMWKYVVAHNYSVRSERLSRNAIPKETPHISKGTTSSTKSDKLKKIKGNEDDKGTEGKKRDILWNTDLQRRFHAALDYLGNAAVPSKVLKCMNVPGLTRSQVSSHLQKYRAKERNGLLPIAPHNRGSEAPLNNPNQFQDQAIQSNPQLNHTTPGPMNQQTTPWSSSPIPSNPAGCNLSNMQSFMMNLKLNEDTEANQNSEVEPIFGAMTGLMQYDAWGNNTYPMPPNNNNNPIMQSDVWGNTTYALSSPNNNTNPMMQYEVLGDNTLSLPTNNNNNPMMQYDSWRSNTLPMPQNNYNNPMMQYDLFGSNTLPMAQNNNINTMIPYDSSGGNTYSMAEFSMSSNNTFVTYDDGLPPMSHHQYSSTSFGQHNYGTGGLGSYNNAADGNDFYDPVEQFAHGSDPLAQVLEDDYRLRFNH